MESITISLPIDATYTTVQDLVGNSYYIMATSKENAPYLANYALESLNNEDRKYIPLELKEKIIQGTGIKYVYTLPSALRWATIGVASGIALKTLSNQELSPAIQEFLSKAKDAIAYSIPFSAWTVIPAVANGAEAIKNTPYIAATLLASAAIATNFVPTSVSTLASDTAESILSVAKKIVSATTDSAKEIGKFCLEYPKAAALTATVGLGFFFRNSLGFSK